MAAVWRSLVALALMLAVAGCKTTQALAPPLPSEVEAALREGVARTTEQFFTWAAGGDLERAMGLVSRQADSPPIRRWLQQNVASFGRPNQVKYVALSQVDRLKDRVTATVAVDILNAREFGGETKRSTCGLTLVKEGGEWRVLSIDGCGYTPMPR